MFNLVKNIRIISSKGIKKMRIKHDNPTLIMYSTIKDLKSSNAAIQKAAKL